jgi:hypothetical protein
MSNRLTNARMAMPTISLCGDASRQNQFPLSYRDRFDSAQYARIFLPFYKCFNHIFMNALNAATPGLSAFAAPQQNAAIFLFSLCFQ